MTRRRSAMVAACLSVCVVLTACADDGKTLREPATGATAPPPPTPSTVSGRQTVGPAGSADNATLQLASTAIAPLEPIRVHAAAQRASRIAELKAGIDEHPIEPALRVVSRHLQIKERTHGRKRRHGGAIGVARKDVADVHGVMVFQMNLARHI